jgi:hypothetical protein
MRLYVNGIWSLIVVLLPLLSEQRRHFYQHSGGKGVTGTLSPGKPGRFFPLAVCEQAGIEDFGSPAGVSNTVPELLFITAIKRFF